MRTLVTGFGPFGNVTDNPSAHLAEGSGRPFHILEVSYAAADAFVQKLDLDGYENLLMLGVAVGREKPTPELFARNWRGSTPDVSGIDTSGPIEEGEPLLIESTLWNAHLLADIEVSLGLDVSMDAGSYLCNYVSYRAIRKFPQKRVGFFHVPSFQKMDQAKQTEILAAVLKKIEA